MTSSKQSLSPRGRFVCGWLAAALLLLLGPGAALALDRYQQVVLTLGSWRTDDIVPMRTFLDRFEQTHPRIRIVFDPTPAPDYDAVLTAQLRAGTGPDLVYLRSFEVSRDLYERGYLASLAGFDPVKARFQSSSLDPWRGRDGVVYGVPFIATAHGVYYNEELFRRLGLAVPTSWEGLIDSCRLILAEGRVPLANASGESWTVLECLLLNILPNFIGGRDGRLEYLSGARCFDDADMIAAFAALEELRPFLPEHQEMLRYQDSLQLFAQGRALMWFGGSWDIGYLETQAPALRWSVFAPPPPDGKPAQLTFHPDAGVGLNAASTHREAAEEFLAWLCEPETGALLAELMPGFYSMHNEHRALSNRHAQAFLALTLDRPTDIRFVWDQLRAGRPDGYTLMRDAAVAVMQGRMSPREAAATIQAGLAQWFEPARACARKPGDAELDQ